MFYLGSLILFSQSFITVILWSLPIWPIVEISYLGFITERVSLNKRSQTIGLVNSAIALGSMIGTFILTFTVNSSYINLLILIPVFVPIVIVLLLLPIRKDSLDKN